jgi:hypothetical protein
MTRERKEIDLSVLRPDIIYALNMENKKEENL